MAEPALIALGSNLGDPLLELRNARHLLTRLGLIERSSSLYRTTPVGGPPEQADYLNAVIVLRPAERVATPRALLDALHEIERSRGRARRITWEARTLDLDLLAFGDQVVDEPGLIVPHPRLMERPFVLAPLCEVLPEWRHPVTGRLAREALAGLPAEGVTRTALAWAPPS